jgi:hypothetical protein
MGGTCQLHSGWVSVDRLSRTGMNGDRRRPVNATSGRCSLQMQFQFVRAFKSQPNW